MVGHTFVFSPPVRKVKELIDAGLIGPIYYVETTRVNLGLFQKDVSVLWDLGPHDVSILIYWLGEVPIQVSARGRSYLGEALEDVAFLTLEFPSGILAQVQISWLAPSKLRRTSVVGRQKMIVYDDLEPVEKVKVFDRGVDRQPASFGEFQLTYRSGDILEPARGPHRAAVSRVRALSGLHPHGPSAGRQSAERRRRRARDPGGRAVAALSGCAAGDRSARAWRRSSRRRSSARRSR